MAISFEVLGKPGQDNALYVKIDSGHSIERLLFDCGDQCLSDLPFGEIQQIDELFFSHLHMDHVAGFDQYFRCVFDRKSKRNRIWGPPETSRILQHRFRGYLWNLHPEMSGAWTVCDVESDDVHCSRFELSEAFERRHAEESRVAVDGWLCGSAHFNVHAVTMDHRTPTLAYVVREKARRNINLQRLQQHGLKPGSWVRAVKDSIDGEGTVVVDGTARSINELQGLLMDVTPGDSVGYLTDFLLSDETLEHTASRFHDCHTIVCEAQYRGSDHEMAQRNFHMTTVLAARLARVAGAQKLVLFHLSSRYTPEIWIEMLQEARRIFPAAEFPPAWNLG